VRRRTDLLAGPPPSSRNLSERGSPSDSEVNAQGRVKVVVQASELRGCRQGRAAARRQHGRAVRRIEPPGHSDLAGRPVLTLRAGSQREGSAASPGPVSTISAGQTDISDFDAALGERMRGSRPSVPPHANRLHVPQALVSTKVTGRMNPGRSVIQVQQKEVYLCDTDSRLKSVA
jgi:hypothetical protein